MLPGSFPESTPIEIPSSTSSLPKSGSVGPSSSERTTADNFQTQLRSADSQSKSCISAAPIIGVRNSCLGSASFPHGSKRLGRDIRTTSDPIPTRRPVVTGKEREPEQMLQRKRPRYDSNPRLGLSTSPISSRHDPDWHKLPKSDIHRAARPYGFVNIPLDSARDNDGTPESSEQKRYDRTGHRHFLSTPSKSAEFSHRRLRDELLNTLTPKDTKGVIYILCDPGHPELGYKIGSTKRDGYEARIKEHQRDCQFRPHVVYSSEYEVEYCGRVESLIHIDLGDFCQHWRCAANHKSSSNVAKTQTHEEWFQVSEAFAVQTVKRWETFMRQETPYGWGRQMTSIRKHLLEKRWDGHYDVATFTDEFRRNQWDHILGPPTTADYFTYCRESVWAAFSTTRNAIMCTRLYFQAFAWQLVALLYSMFTLLLCPNIVAFSLFVLVLGFASTTVLSHVQLDCPKRKPRSPKKIA